MRVRSLLMAVLGGSALAAGSDPVRSVRLSLAGWSEGTAEDGARFWDDANGNVLSLAAVDGSASELLDPASELELRRSARRLAEVRGGGLIEVTRTAAGHPPMVRLIYKRLERPAYVYTGMLFMAGPPAPLVWTVVAGERGTTGMREAIVTAELMKSGGMDLDEYKTSWARDPYDPGYGGVPRSVLRFRSDDELYDERFPQHPLSKVRRVLAALPASVTRVR